MTAEPQAAGDPIPSNCEVIEVHVAELKQLFNAIDPSPFREKDLDPKADEFIVSWARDLPADAHLALLVYLDRPAGLPEEAAVLRDAIREYFSQRTLASQRRLRQLFRVGRTSLVIGTACLAVSLLLGDLIAKAFSGYRLGELLRESLLIGGWVAMWRPMEVFLYDWWPIRSEVRLFERLSVMPVRIAYTREAASEAWRWDWPAVPVVPPRPNAPPTAGSAGTGQEPDAASGRLPHDG
ncbi:MAG TPA: hypothetical protein VLJ83_02625 [Gemmatimonadaceae bacterium]|nr:hypothetical protein [Gemmatimonadaceae bacterium]